MGQHCGCALDIRKGTWLLSPRDRDGLDGSFVPPLVASPVLLFVEGQVNPVYARNIKRLPYQFLDSLDIARFNNFVEGERWDAAWGDIVDFPLVSSICGRSVSQLRVVLRNVLSDCLSERILIATGNPEMANKRAIGSLTTGKQCSKHNDQKVGGAHWFQEAQRST